MSNVQQLADRVARLENETSADASARIKRNDESAKRAQDKADRKKAADKAAAAESEE